MQSDIIAKLIIGEDKLIEQHLRDKELSDDVRLHQCRESLDQAFTCVQQVTDSGLSQVQAVLLSPACAPASISSVVMLSAVSVLVSSYSSS